MTPNLILLIPEKRDVERDVVAQAWEAAGGEVLHVGRFWDPPAVDVERVRVYGNDTFCLVLAEKLGLDLVTPDDRLMCAAGPALLRRTLAVESLSDALQIGFPAFVKPVVPKQFAAAVYGTASELMAATPGLPDDTEVFVSEIVSFKAEARSFVVTPRRCPRDELDDQRHARDAQPASSCGSGIFSPRTARRAALRKYASGSMPASLALSIKL